jgi:hypothetical protein
VYYAVGFPPLAPRPVRTEHASYRGRLSGLHLTPQGQMVGGLVNPSKFRLEVLFDMAAWCHRESPLTLHSIIDVLLIVQSLLRSRFCGLVTSGNGKHESRCSC